MCHTCILFPVLIDILGPFFATIGKTGAKLEGLKNASLLGSGIVLTSLRY